MASVALGIQIDAKQVAALFQRAPEATEARLRQLIEGGAIDVQRQMMMRATRNVGATGDYRRSIRYTLTPLKLEAEIGPNVPYADDLEDGTRPHWVSVKPGSSLARWANLKGINPYAIQHSIAKKGTKPHPIVHDTYNKMKGPVTANIARGMARFVQEMNDGRI